MVCQSIRLLAGCCLLSSIFSPVKGVKAQDTPPAFDSSAIEAATTISSDGTCSNPIIGISYQIPKGFRAEDAATVHRNAYDVDARTHGVGPEARWFLWGYGEKQATALVCGAGGKGNDRQGVQLIAMPLSVLKRQGATLDQLVQGLGQEFGVKSSPVRQTTVNGLRLECADVQVGINSPVRGGVQVWATTCAGTLREYVVIWELIGFSDAQQKALFAGLDSVKVLTPHPFRPTAVGPHAPITGGGPIAPDFKSRLDEFIRSWLAERDTGKTMAFFDQTAYSAPSLIGSYCTGWYRTGAPAREVARFMSNNLMGAPNEYPKGTQAASIFTAWDRLPAQWLSVSANDVAKEHFLVVSLDSTSLDHIFSGIFSGSEYGKYVRSRVQKNPAAYWVIFPQIMPDHDIFVIFMLWQKAAGTWKITDMDVVCQ